MHAQKERWACCPLCGKHTAGKWAKLPDGAFRREPRTHRTESGETCAGSFMEAILN
ncbi:hypothetical protein OLX02_18520 [Novosphingobium sp. KCTC 2891]|nr:hypothetical protein [Novosphingobium sp. KCTC 2891]